MNSSTWLILTEITLLKPQVKCPPGSTKDCQWLQKGWFTARLLFNPESVTITALLVCVTDIPFSIGTITEKPWPITPFLMYLCNILELKWGKVQAYIVR